MEPAALGDLVVEVLHNRGGQQVSDWSVGSGFVVRPGVVLTAGHNVGPGELIVRAANGQEHRASVLKQGEDGQVDLAIVEVASLLTTTEAHYGRVDRHAAALVRGCWAVGFPRFK